MAVKLSAEEVGKLGPAAQSQIRAVQPDERPKPKRRRRNAEELRIARAKAAREEGKTSAFFGDRQQRATEREQRRQSTVRRKLAAQKAGEQRAKQQGRQRRGRSAKAFAGGVAVGAIATHRRAARTAVSPGTIFGTITGAALIGALVFRANTIAALLGHMTSYWQRVIGLGKATK